MRSSLAPSGGAPSALTANESVLTNAAGTAKTVETASAVLRTSSPLVVLGSFTLRERGGNSGTVDYFGDLFSLNVRGIPSPPPEVWTRTVREVVREAEVVGKRVCVSVAAFEPAEYGTLAGLAFEANADAVELNFGCPNMQDGSGFAPIFSYRPEMVAEAVDAVAPIGGECWAKVSPVFDDALFAELVAALRHPAIDGVVAVNTVPQCLALDKNGAPVLSFRDGVGGMAGPAIKPIALAQAARYVRAGFRTIGVGGISSGKDLCDFQNVGVESCQANTVIQAEGASALDRIMAEAFADRSPVSREAAAVGANQEATP